ncbi:hypothetical protein OQA88_12109 [Cercophora sp. LCS_1]
MAYLDLSRRDIDVLQKIKDPESEPSATVYIDPTLPKDPHLRDPSVYEKTARKERDVILEFQKLEAQQFGIPSSQPPSAAFINGFRSCVDKLSQIIEEHPDYASARNNRVQALRRLCGDSLLVGNTPQLRTALLRELDETERLDMALTVLSDLDQAISLLTPKGGNLGMSQNASRTLAQAHTQRGAMYHITSKLMGQGTLSVPPGRREERWTGLDFEEQASLEFARGGLYGNEIAKGLAVGTNPTAKLCGQMVREAMKKEYGQFPLE